MRRAVHHPEGQPSDRLPKEDQQHGRQQRDAQRADQHGRNLREIPGPVRLRGQTARSHAQKCEVPVNKVEDRRTDADPSDQRVVTQMPDDGHIDHAQQRDRDVRHDIRNGQREYLAVHGGKGITFSSFVHRSATPDRKARLRLPRPGTERAAGQKASDPDRVPPRGSLDCPGCENPSESRRDRSLRSGIPCKNTWRKRTIQRSPIIYFM